MIGIYLITNLSNNKKYVGQSINIEMRWREHMRPSTTSQLNKDIQLLGEDNFKFEILYQCEQDQLNPLERESILYYDSLRPNGYNITLPNLTDKSGESFVFYNKEVIDQIFEDLKKTILSAQEIANKNGVHKRTVYHINKGDSHFRQEEVYPLRAEMKASEPNKCIDCGKRICPQSNRCKKCYSINMRKVDRPSGEALIKEVALNGFKATGDKYGVTDNAIKKWLKGYNLPYLLDDVKKLYGNFVPKRTKKFNWRDHSLTLIKDNQETYYETGEKAIFDLVEKESSKYSIISVGIGRVVSGKRNSYLGFTIKN